jgi:hypothetical protein
MKRLVMISAAIAVFAACGAARAQTDAGETPEKLALAREVFQSVNMPQMMDSITAVTNNMQQSLIRQGTPEQQQKVAIFQRAMNAQMKEVFIPKIVDQMAHGYARTFTEGELRDIIAFYQSPTGRSMTAKMPAMMRAFTPMIMQDVPELLRGTFTRYCAETPCTPEERADLDKALARFPAAH